MTGTDTAWLSLLVMTLGTAFVAALAAWGLSRFSRLEPDSEEAQREALVDRIEDCLPRTQCAQCGYPGCRPYAEALLDKQVSIDQCPPGGLQTITRLAELLGDELPTQAPTTPPIRVARIREIDCIGCALCLPVCPTDAIVGAHRYMHTVIAAECTGCELCIAPCPVDCIDLVEVAPSPERIAWTRTA